MPQPEWEELAHDVHDLRTRVARIEAAMGLAADAETAEFPAAATAPTRGPADSGLLDSPTSTGCRPRPARPGGRLSAARAHRIGSHSARHREWRSGFSMPSCGWCGRRAHRRPGAGDRAPQLDGSAGAVARCCGKRRRVSTPSPPGRPARLLVFTVFGLAVSWRKDMLIVATIATLAGLGTGGAADRHSRCAAVHIGVSGDCGGGGGVGLPGPLAERALAGGIGGRSCGAAGHVAGDQRAGCRRLCAHPPFRAAGGAGGAAGDLSFSTIVRTLLRGFTFTGFETMQCAVAFAISVGGGLQLSSHDSRVASAMAVLALACAGACYLVSFLMLDRGAEHGRNFYTYSTFGILLAIAGSRILAVGRRCVDCVERARRLAHLGGRTLRTSDPAGARRHLPAAGARGIECARAGGGLTARFA